MYKIRRVYKDDLSKIIDIENNSFQLPWPIFLFKENINNPGFIVYENEGNVLGYAIIGTVNKTAHLLSIAVDPKYRRKKIGSLLLQTCLQISVYYKYKKITLEVRQSNTQAQNFYLNHGFIIKTIIHGYYVDEDAMSMQLDL